MTVMVGTAVESFSMPRFATVDYRRFCRSLACP